MNSRFSQPSHRRSCAWRFDASCMSSNTTGPCPSPRAEMLAAHNAWRWCAYPAPDDPRHPSTFCVKPAIPRPCDIMHSGIDRPENQTSRSGLESYHVGVSHRAAQRWFDFDLMLPAHGRPHNSGAGTAAKQRKRGANRHDSVFFRDVSPPDQDAKWALPS